MFCPGTEATAPVLGRSFYKVLKVPSPPPLGLSTFSIEGIMGKHLSFWTQVGDVDSQTNCELRIQHEPLDTVGGHGLPEQIHQLCHKESLALFGVFRGLKRHLFGVFRPLKRCMTF